jgi:NAD(P)H-binding
VRAAGVPYAVVRPTGLTTEEEDERFLLEARQGDAISGKISRAEVAQVVARALGTPLAAGVHPYIHSLASCCAPNTWHPSGIQQRQGVQWRVAGVSVPASGLAQVKVHG